MEPAKLDERELGCIDFFWFCCLLSSARLAHILGHPGFILGHLGFILDHLGSIWGHPGSILAPQSLPKLAQT